MVQAVLSAYINIWWEGMKKSQKDSSRECSVTGQKAMTTNWNTRKSLWNMKKSILLWGWSNTGIGYPERMWSLPTWRYSRPRWTQTWATHCSWPHMWQEAPLKNFQRFFPGSALLWLHNTSHTTPEILRQYSLRWFVFAFLTCLQITDTVFALSAQANYSLVLFRIWVALTIFRL